MALSEIQQRILAAVCSQPTLVTGKSISQLLQELDCPESARTRVTAHLFYLKKLGLVFNEWGKVGHRNCHMWFPKAPNAEKTR